VKGRLLTVLAAAAAMALATAGCGDLSRAELKRRVETLGSLAAEGELVAHDVEYDRTKTTFVRVHAGELSSAASDEAEKVNDATVAAGYEREAEKTIALAGDISDALDQLRVFAGDETRARDARAKLQQATRDAEDLAGQL
jgi:hypothetical protein